MAQQQVFFPVITTPSVFYGASLGGKEALDQQYKVPYGGWNGEQQVVLQADVNEDSEAVLDVDIEHLKTVVDATSGQVDLVIPNARIQGLKSDVAHIFVDNAARVSLVSPVFVRVDDFVTADEAAAIAGFQTPSRPNAYLTATFSGGIQDLLANLSAAGKPTTSLSVALSDHNSADVTILGADQSTVSASELSSLILSSSGRFVVEGRITLRGTSSEIQALRLVETSKLLFRESVRYLYTDLPSTPPTSDGSTSSTSVSPASPSPIPSQQKEEVVIDSSESPSGLQVDDDGDGLLEPLRTADGLLVDGNRDGIADALQDGVVAIRLINDGSRSSDYGSISFESGTRIADATLLEPDPLTGLVFLPGPDSGLIQVSLPGNGLAKLFEGVLRFDVVDQEPGAVVPVIIDLPSGMPEVNSDDLFYTKYNFESGRFEEFVDRDGTPLYRFLDKNLDGQPDAVALQLIDGDQRWDGDRSANGTIVDPGFLATAERELQGTRADDEIVGNIMANRLFGKRGSDLLIGDLGDDLIRGGPGDDWLDGGFGADHLIGGSGFDTYVYRSADESTADAPDLVEFHIKDALDFRSFDADQALDGRQPFRFIGSRDFSGHRGELRATTSGLFADLDGDLKADFSVRFADPVFFFSGSNLLL